MRYYLETNSLRKLNTQLENLKEVSFTSALSIFELISGIRDQDFHIRKNVIENIFKSEIEIVWLFPEEVIINAFRGLEFKEERIRPLKKLCQCLLKSNNMKAFVRNGSKGKYNLDFFKNLDKQYSDRFIKATLIGNKNLKKIIENEDEKHAINFSKNFIKTLPDIGDLNNSVTLKSICSNLKDALELSSGELIDERKIYESYSGNIDIFISAFSLFTARKNAEFNTPAKNDFVDLHHLIYLTNKDNFIITDDKMISKVTNQVKKVIDFVKEMGYNAN